MNSNGKVIIDLTADSPPAKKLKKESVLSEAKVDGFPEVVDLRLPVKVVAIPSVTPDEKKDNKIVVKKRTGKKSGKNTQYTEQVVLNDATCPVCSGQLVKRTSTKERSLGLKFMCCAAAECEYFRWVTQPVK